MSIFGTILQKLGIQKPAAPVAPAAPAVAPNVNKMVFTPSQSAAPAAPVATPVASPATTVAPPKPVAIPVVDVVSKLNTLAGTNSGLDWKVSIVDLLKLLGIDSSLNARKELATELGCPADLMGDSAKMNTWLHKTVLQKIAENGGNIPDSLLH